MRKHFFADDVEIAPSSSPDFTGGTFADNFHEFDIATLNDPCLLQLVPVLFCFLQSVFGLFVSHVEKLVLELLFFYFFCVMTANGFDDDANNGDYQCSDKNTHPWNETVAVTDLIKKSACTRTSVDVATIFAVAVAVALFCAI